MKIKELFEDTNAETRKWLSKWETACRGTLEKYRQEMSNYDIQHNGDIIYHGNLYILDDDFLDENSEIPIQVKQCRRIQIGTTNLTSFNNCPKELSGVSQNLTDHIFVLRQVFGDKSIFNNLTSLEGITPIIHGHVNLSAAPNISYSNANKHVKRIDGSLRINGNYKGPLLSLLKIQNLTMVYGGIDTLPEFDKACSIISNFLLRKDRNIIACQEELIKNGLKEYAKL